MTIEDKKIILHAIRKYGKATIPFLQRRFKWSYEKCLDVLKALELNEWPGPF